MLFLLLYFQGEPFLNPDIYDMIKYARSKKIYVGTSTNGHYFRTDEDAINLVKSGLNVLIYSIDGTDQETYAKYRKEGDLAVALDGLRRLVRIRKMLQSVTPKIYVQFLVFRHNEHQVEEIQRLTREIGADRILLKTAQIDLKSPEIGDLLPQNARFRRYKMEGNRAVLAGSFRNRCRKLWTSPVITVDGQVVHGCFDKDADHAFGTLTFNSKTRSDSTRDSGADSGAESGVKNGRRSFKDIWQSEENRRFRTTLLADRSRIDICRNCTEGIKIFE